MGKRNKEDWRDRLGRTGIKKWIKDEKSGGEEWREEVRKKRS